jgi:hypothetical protein
MFMTAATAAGQKSIIVSGSYHFKNEKGYLE